LGRGRVIGLRKAGGLNSEATVDKGNRKKTETANTIRRLAKAVIKLPVKR